MTTKFTVPVQLYKLYHVVSIYICCDSGVEISIVRPVFVRLAIAAWIFPPALWWWSAAIGLLHGPERL